MKYNKLAPNAHFTKEWEGYMKSWTLHKKQKAQKRKSVSASVSALSLKANEKKLNDFSIQEIKVAAQKYTVTFVSCLTNDKLNH